MRWPETDGKPVCPKCGCTESYDIATRRKHKCKACHHQFSVTSGTILASRKMSFTDLLAAIVIIINGAKGVSALQLARDLDCQHKTAFVLGQDRIDRRLWQHQTGKRRVVVIARERKGRTLTTVTKTEADGVNFVAKVVRPGSTVHADEASHWDALHAKFQTMRINHQQAYSFNGACTNQAESFLARLRRMVEGQHHHVSPQHLHQYAVHAAWMEDHRRKDNGTLTRQAVSLAMAHGISRTWKGYWQRMSIS